VLGEIGRVAAHVGERGFGRLAHDIAELPGDGQPALARHRRGLDEEQLAADRRPGQPSGYAGVGRPPAHVAGEARPPQHLVDPLLRDRALARARAARVLSCGLAAHGTDLALELAHAGLARVVADDPPQRRVRERDLALRQPGALDLAWRQVAAGDLELLLLGVAGELDDLHAIAQRAGHAVEVVGRADEDDLREVEG